MRRLYNFLSIPFGLAIVISFPGCECNKEEVARVDEDWNRQLGDGEVALRKLDPSEYPDFSQGFFRKRGLEQAAMYNIEYLSKPSSEQYFPYLDVSHSRALASNEAFIEVLQQASSPEELDQMIKARFEVYQSRGWNDRGDVLFTGYYRPIFDARFQPTGEYQYPLYKRPPDLVRNEAAGKYERQTGGPYYSRREINNGALAGKGLEIAYLRDPFEAYIVTVQGSGRLRMGDGGYFDIGYHGDNGHEYKSIGQWLVSENLIRPEELSLPGLIKFFKENPAHMKQALDLNPRYVFFTPRTGGPFGSLNVPVTPFRSIATDKAVYPRASVTFIDTLVPARSGGGVITNHDYKGFAMDQDTGGAIRAAGRCDFFLGTGDEVGELAGRTLSKGKIYYIFVRESGSGQGHLAGPAPITPVTPAPSEEYDDFDGLR